MPTWSTWGLLTPRKAAAAGHAFRRADVDLLFLHVSTYALSSTVLPVVRPAKVPVILLNLNPLAAIDYASFNRMGARTAMTGEWLAHCQAAARQDRQAGSAAWHRVCSRLLRRSVVPDITNFPCRVAVRVYLRHCWNRDHLAPGDK